MKNSRRRSPADAAAILASLGIDKAAEQESAGPDQERSYATVYFDGDSVVVGDDYLDLVRQCAERFVARPAGLMIIAGHAMAVDEPEQEVELSHRRTRAVATLLEELGVASHQIVCVSRGANEPLVDPSDSARRWINRRVEISEGALVPRAPAWAQQRRKKKAAAAKAGSGTKPSASSRAGATGAERAEKAPRSLGWKPAAGVRTSQKR
jgi:hypothetical protein